MFNNKSCQEYNPVCNLVPGYAFYDEFGDRLAEVVLEIFESIADLIGRFRT